MTLTDRQSRLAPHSIRSEQFMYAFLFSRQHTRYFIHQTAPQSFQNLFIKHAFPIYIYLWHLRPLFQRTVILKCWSLTQIIVTIFICSEVRFN